MRATPSAHTNESSCVGRDGSGAGPSEEKTPLDQRDTGRDSRASTLEPKGTTSVGLTMDPLPRPRAPSSPTRSSLDGFTES